MLGSTTCSEAAEGAAPSAWRSVRRTRRREVALALGVSGLPQWERKALTEEEEAPPEADDAFIVAKAAWDAMGSPAEH